ncbi:MAG: calcium/sodium antiporter [Dehalococcoidia bacterium]|nr:calcium/sodium antiporter [Dehalococcoidia bacterium]
MLAVVWLVIGLVLLVAAGDRLVTSAGRLALRLGMSTVVIGATVVAFGTSMPEFTVSLLSALSGSEGVAAGNVIGSNIANVLLVLGIASIITPLAIHRRMLRFDVPILLAVTAWALVVFADGEVSRIEGIASVVMLLVFSVVQLKWFSSPEVQAEPEPEFEGLPVPEETEHVNVAAEVPILAVAIGALAFGSWLFVRGASELAEAVGISDFAIGATVVAVGTSLPEVVTSAIAAFKKEDDIAIGNVVGSNLFNVLGVLGGAAAASPIAVSQDLYAFELPVLAVSALILVPLMWRRAHIGRIEGVLLLAGFVAFTALTLIRGGS